MRRRTRCPIGEFQSIELDRRLIPGLVKGEYRLCFVLIDDLEIVSREVGDRLAADIKRYRIEADKRAGLRSLRQKAGHSTYNWKAILDIALLPDAVYHTLWRWRREEVSERTERLLPCHNVGDMFRGGFAALNGGYL